MKLPLPGPIALRAAHEAELNTHVREEGGNNRGKFIRIYLAAVRLFTPNPWCLAMLVFRLLDAATDLALRVPDDMPRTGYTPTFANWGKSRGWWIPVADARADPSLVRRGDFAFFYKAGIRRIGHVGVVTRVLADGTGFEGVEGNTSSGVGVNRDGDGVYRRRRTWANLGVKGGLVRLPF